MSFYVLEKAPQGIDETARTDFLKAGRINRRDAPKCENCGKYIGMKKWVPPYTAVIETWGSQFGDLAFNGGEDMLISRRFFDLWKESELQGLEDIQPVKVNSIQRHRKIFSPPPEYLKATVCKSMAAVDQVVSGIEWEAPPICDVCQLGSGLLRWNGIVIVPNSWQGQDIFIARGLPGSDFICSERFKSFCERHGILNAILVKADTYNGNLCPWKK